MQAWSELDPHATGYIPALQLSMLLAQLEPPLGMHGDSGGAAAHIQAALMSTDIPMHGTQVGACPILAACMVAMQAKWLVEG